MTSISLHEHSFHKVHGYHTVHSLYPWLSVADISVIGNTEQLDIIEENYSGWYLSVLYFLTTCSQAKQTQAFTEITQQPLFHFTLLEEKFETLSNVKSVIFLTSMFNKTEQHIA